MTTLFSGDRPRLDDALVTGYASATEQLADVVSLAADALDRAALVGHLRAIASPSVAEVDATLRALDARIAESRRWIEQRIAASSSVLPLGELVMRFGLTDADVWILALLAAVEIDAALLDRLGSPPPVGLDATTLYAALGWPQAPQPEWFRHTLGRDSARASAGLVRFPDGVLPMSRRPITLARPVLARITGVAAPDDLADAIVRPCTELAEHPRAAELGAVMSTGGIGVALWIFGAGPRLGLATAVAAVDQRSAVVVDVAALARDVPARQRVAIADQLALEQRLDDRAVVLQFDQLVEPDQVRAARLVVERLAGPCILISPDENAALGALAVGAHRVTFPRPDAAERHHEWIRQLGGAARELGDAALVQLANDFPLDAMEIEEIVHALGRVGTPITIELLRATALARQRSRLGRLTQFVPPGFAFEDLVLPDEDLARLYEIVARQQHRETVFGRWNMASKVPYGTGTAALFAGPPGTGKTMAASVIARMIGRELFRVDLSRVVDKYIGETEKNLGAIFDAAVDANAILLFDEADSLFAKRTTVQSSHDRYANLETNYLLQRIEEHPGISILTTNNAQSIDPAFARRLQFRVEFPFPDELARTEIWRRCLTPEVPIAADVDFALLGQVFELSGANIKSAVLRAAFGAATDGMPITTEALADAAAREFENAGKLPPAFPRARR